MIVLSTVMLKIWFEIWMKQGQTVHKTVIDRKNRCRKTERKQKNLKPKIDKQTCNTFAHKLITGDYLLCKLL